MLLIPFRYYYVFHTSFGVSSTIGMSSIRMNSAESDRSIGGTYVQKMFSPKSNISVSSKKNKDEKQRFHFKLFIYLFQLKTKMKNIIITILSSFLMSIFLFSFYFILFYFILFYFIFSSRGLILRKINFFQQYNLILFLDFSFNYSLLSLCIYSFFFCIFALNNLHINACPTYPITPFYKS